MPLRKGRERMPRYIDVDKLLVDLKRANRSMTSDGWTARGVWAIIERQPAADVAEVRHGRWVRASGMMPPEAFGVYECSLCGYTQDYHIPTRLRKKTPYCPWCGAKLEGNDNADQ